MTRRALLVGLGAVAALPLAAACQTPAPTPSVSAKAGAEAPTAAKPAERAAEKPAPAAAATTAPAPEQAAPAAAKPAGAARQVTLQYWYATDSQDQTKLHTDSIARFQEKYPNVVVQAELVPWGDSLKKLLAANAAGTGVPDTSMVDSGRLAPFHDAGMLVPLDDRFKGWKYAEDMLPNVREMARARPGAPIVGMTNLVLVDYIYYRPDWFADAKLKPPDTNEEMLEAARALNRPPERFGYTLRAGDGGSTGQVGPMLKGNGVEFVKADGTVDLDSPEAVETVDWFVSFHTKHKVTQPSALGDRAPEIYALYQSGKVAQMTHGLRTWKIFADAMGEKAAAFQFPRGKKGRFVPTGMNGSSVYTLSKSQDEGWALVAHLAEPETARPFSVERGSPPTLKSMENDAIYRENRFFKVASESGPAWGQLPSYHKNWAKLSDRWKPEMDRLLKEEITAEAFCKTMAGLLRS